MLFSHVAVYVLKSFFFFFEFHFIVLSRRPSDLLREDMYMH